ncbi:ABC transporter ATP-binding protein [Chitinophagaceae bacterium LWZ2-11]
MIVAKNVMKKFGKLQVLNDISVTCNKGECIALIGPNGSGKTTLIKCFLGMVLPDAGIITFKGENIAHSWMYRKDIGYMPQIGRYPENMTIGQVLDMMKDLRADKGGIDDDLIMSFKIQSLLKKRMGTLSGGTRQKVSACLAFMFNQEILILDEPTAGLDPVSSEILKEKIEAEKQKGKLILITSHVLSDLDDLVTQIIYMQEGQLIFHKTGDELRSLTSEDRLNRAIAKIMLNRNE